MKGREGKGREGKGSFPRNKSCIMQKFEDVFYNISFSLFIYFFSLHEGFL